MKIRTIPTLVLFFDGVAKDKIVGFEDLADKMLPGKEDEWPTIALARLLASKGSIDSSNIVDDDEVEAVHASKFEEMRQNVFSGIYDDEEDDFDLNSS